MGVTKAVPAPFTKGVNFTNWLEYRTAEQIDADMYTKQDFINAKALGCDVVRLPIHFERICEGIGDYTIPTKIMDILDKVATWVEELKLYVIFDFHNNTHADSVTSVDVENVLTPIWKQLAERMPALPEEPTEEERKKFEDYPEQGTVEAVEAFFDQYVEFSVERKSPVFCGEFGCFAPFAKHEERVNWYQIVTNLLEERGIARTSWDYFGTFGIYKFDKSKFGKGKPEWKFPEDLDLDIVKALRLNAEFE